MSKHGKGTIVMGNGYNLSNGFRGATISHTIDLAMNTGYTDAAPSRVVGLRDGALDLDGYYDAAAGGVDAVMAPLVGTGSDIYTISPGSSADGDIFYGTTFHMSTYQVEAPVDDIVSATINGDSIVGWDRGIVIHAIGAEVATGTGSTFDNLASSAAGGSAYAFCTAGTGFGTLDLDIRDSNDNFVGNDNSLGAFTQITAANSKERITFSGTVERYVRIKFTIVTATTVTFWVGFSRT